MFSGIVQKKCSIISIEDASHLRRFIIDLEDLAHDLRIGASVSVSGVCLTVIAVENTRVSFEVIQETLSKTTLGGLKKGDRVNIERSIKVGDEIGGHVLSGHIMGTGMISTIETSLNTYIVTITCQTAEWMEYILSKGFIAIDGCSLTVVDIGRDWFTIHLIPETLRVTTFSEKKIGDKVNIEIDAQTQVIVETIKRYIQKPL